MRGPEPASELEALTRRFRKVLIANRGEIAVRVARACSELGITSVAVYSEADADALHVRVCDEAYLIGPPPASESYLRGDKIIEVARQAGCDAIHPGFGFLSENAEFARSVIDAGIAWVGPSPEAIALMGSKIEAKKLAEQVGVPVVPGYFGQKQSFEVFQEAADRIGYPVLVKASAGGGGKGMRVVDTPVGLRDSIEGAKREAASAFGDDTLMIEKYLTEPRHIEVQVLGDNFGNLIHLGERECSIQRRHQKVLEESPSPAVDDELREQITSSALVLARAAGYSNAGTVEFIFQDSHFYFLEMNTRLQVEHPVTEEALDIDLVEAQLRIAAGERLWLEQEDIDFVGHAFEVRLYAEDPANGFLPSTGKITEFDVPPEDEYVRLDPGAAQGDSITPYYDPMIAKVIASGPTRAESLRRMREVLGGLKVAGVTTNLDFLRWLVAHPQFEMGNLSTRFIEKYYRPGAFPIVPTHVLLAGAAVRLTSNEYLLADDLFAWRGNAWRLAAQDMQVAFVVDGHDYKVTLSALSGSGNKWRAHAMQGDTTLYDGDVSLRLRPSTALEPNGVGEYSVAQIMLSGEPQYSIRYSWGEADDIYLLWERREYRLQTMLPLSTEWLNKASHKSTENSLESPMPGKVLKLMVGSGESVVAEQPLVIIEAMKMEFTVRAPHDGKVAAVNFAQGDQVAVGDVLIEMERD